MPAPSKAVREPSGKFARLACLLPSNRHCYYSMQRRTHVKQRRAVCPVNVLQAYTRQSNTTSTITSKSFENFRRHFLKINFRYNVRFLISTATYIDIYIYIFIVCCHGNVEKMEGLNCDIIILHITWLAGS